MTFMYTLGSRVRLKVVSFLLHKLLSSLKANNDLRAATSKDAGNWSEWNSKALPALISRAPEA